MELTEVLGIGPKTALKLVQEHKTLEKILELPKMSKAKIDFDVTTVRKLFLKPAITTDYTLSWSSPNIDKIVDLTRSENDHATEIFLQWFVDEQVEEEASALEIVQKLKLIKDSPNGLFMLDSLLGKRE